MLKIKFIFIIIVLVMISTKEASYIKRKAEITKVWKRHKRVVR